MPRAAAANTPQRILDVAERLVQTRGFNGFSYADIASALAVTKASLHYHFATKGELGRRLIERYEATFLRALAEIDRGSADPRDKLRRYAAIYADVLRANRMCLCGMLAAEYATLPREMQKEMRHFFDENERWLAAVLEQGRASAHFRFAGPALDVARAIVGSFEGAMMIARSYGDAARFQVVVDRVLGDLHPHT